MKNRRVVCSKALALVLPAIVGLSCVVRDWSVCTPHDECQKGYTCTADWKCVRDIDGGADGLVAVDSHDTADAPGGGPDAPGSAGSAGSGGTGASNSTGGTTAAGGTTATGGIGGALATGGTGGITISGGTIAAGDAGGTTPPEAGARDASEPDVSVDAPVGPDTGRADLACTATAFGSCCGVADCMAGGAGTAPACIAGVCSYPCAVSYKTCGVACIAADRCCSNTDCAATPSTPQCSAGTCVGGVLSIAPASQPFGSIVVGQSSPATTFVVTNTGTGDTGILTALVAGSSEFGVTANTCSTTKLSSNQTCSVSIRLSPTSTGEKSATLQVTASPGGSLSAALTGAGLGPAALAIDPATFTFATAVTGGSTSTTTGLTIKNTGAVAAGTTLGLAATLTGANASDFVISTNTCTGSLSASGSCAVVLAFKPAALNSGSKTATLVVSATPGGVATAVLAGTAQECDTHAQCTVANKPICLSHACRPCTEGTTAGAGLGCVSKAECNAKTNNAPECVVDPSDPAFGQCVECWVGATQCGCDSGGSAPTCAPSNTCTACNSPTIANPDSACDLSLAQDGSTYHFCSVGNGRCQDAECLTDSNCPDPEYGLYCVSHACGFCRTDADCVGSPNGPHCVVGTGSNQHYCGP